MNTPKKTKYYTEINHITTTTLIPLTIKGVAQNNVSIKNSKI